ncbi:origin recognition complex subunit 2-domain-containing protein [Multifurca ochricompacta]|uniref:Origin recognition complex subunit 2 n=1 Tax=Multifurca ochricompacta TaxID=376703 RepID=A0AAD4M8H3_9AGAM|nr:origin recognition complex subunit 2-domain-containing protein [Multifurca ochricompacta]
MNFSSDDQDSEFYSELDSLSTLTSFDAYFSHASRPSRTSSNVFSQLVQPLSPEEYLTRGHRAHLPRYLLELAEASVLNNLAHACATRGRAHVLVINGFQPSFSPRNILAALARLPGAPQGVEGVAQFLSESPARRRRLVLIVHNIDAPALRSLKVRTLLGALGALSGVQMAASIDHINAPFLWTWLWHDLTTLAPYDAELAGADPGSLRTTLTARTVAGMGAEGIRTGPAAVADLAGGQMTETAARHVLAAVTQRARKLFVLMARRQLDSLVDTGNVDPITPADVGEVAIAYDMLFNLARDHFVATNDTALRALLGEFRDHALVVTVGTGVMGTGEMLWIPLRKERLMKLLSGLQQDPP